MKKVIQLKNAKELYENIKNSVSIAKIVAEINTLNNTQMEE